MPVKEMDMMGESSNPMQTREAISAEIEHCMSKPMEGVSDSDKRARCAAMAYSLAREKTGKSLGKKD